MSAASSSPFQQHPLERSSRFLLDDSSCTTCISRPSLGSSTSDSRLFPVPSLSHSSFPASSFSSYQPLNKSKSSYLLTNQSSNPPSSSILLHQPAPQLVGIPAQQQILFPKQSSPLSALSTTSYSSNYQHTQSDRRSAPPYTSPLMDKCSFIQPQTISPPPPASTVYSGFPYRSNSLSTSSPQQQKIQQPQTYSYTGQVIAPHRPQYGNVLPMLSPTSDYSTSSSSPGNTVPFPNECNKRKRRKAHEVERLYRCNYKNCSKSYGTLNHLNSHVTLQNHGEKRSPAEFKRLRDELKKRRKMEKARFRLMQRNGMRHQLQQLSQFTQQHYDKESFKDNESEDDSLSSSKGYPMQQKSPRLMVHNGYQRHQQLQQIQLHHDRCSTNSPSILPPLPQLQYQQVVPSQFSNDLSHPLRYY